MGDELDKLLAQWMSASNEGNAKNILGEKIAELCAHDKLEKVYGSRLKSALIIPRRGDEGAVILDIVYELQEGDIIIAESKFNLSKRGKLKQKIFALDDTVGAAEVWNLEGGITQLDGRWVMDRIKEIEKQDARLARKIRTALEDFKLQVVEIRTVPEIKNGKAVIKNVILKDETQRVNNFKRGIPEQRTLRQKQARSIEKKLAAERSPADHAEKIAKDARKRADDAAKRAQKLKDKAAIAERDANSASRSDVKPRKIREAIAADEAAKKAGEEAAAEIRKAELAEQEYKKLASAMQATDKNALKKAVAAAKKKAETLGKDARAAARKADSAEKAIIREEKLLKKVKRPYAVRNRTRRVEEAKKYAKKVGEEAAKAEELAVKAEEEYKALTGIDVRSITSTATESPATGANLAGSTKATPAPGKRLAKTAEDVTPTESRDISDKAIRSTATDRTATASKGLAEEVKIVARSEDSAAAATAATSTLIYLEKGEEVASKIGKGRALIEISLKGVRIVGKIGELIFTFLDVSGINLLGDIMMLMDAVDFILSIAYRKEIEEKKEWKRLIPFLFNRPGVFRTKFYDVPYKTSIGDLISRLINDTLEGNNSTGQDFLSWQKKWDIETAWEGFVYAEVHCALEEQVKHDSDPDEDYNTKFYVRGPVFVNLVDNTVKNQLTKYSAGILGTADPKNRSTGGKTPPYSDPDFNYDIDINNIDLVFTQPAPVITPFDFIIVKCRALYSAIIAFLSKYDSFIQKDLDEMIGDKFVDEFMGGSLFKDFSFAPSLNGEVVRFCTKSVFQSIKFLSQHVPEAGDFDIDKNSGVHNKGMIRRELMLFNIARPQREYKGKRLFVEIAEQLQRLVNGDSRRLMLKSVDKDLVNLTEDSLSNLAFEIDKDIRRAFADSQKRPYQYQYIGVEKK